MGSCDVYFSPSKRLFSCLWVYLQLGAPRIWDLSQCISGFQAQKHCTHECTHECSLKPWIWGKKWRILAAECTDEPSRLWIKEKACFVSCWVALGLVRNLNSSCRFNLASHVVWPVQRNQGRPQGSSVVSTRSRLVNQCENLDRHNGG